MENREEKGKRVTLKNILGAGLVGGVLTFSGCVTDDYANTTQRQRNFVTAGLLAGLGGAGYRKKKAEARERQKRLNEHKIKQEARLEAERELLREYNRKLDGLRRKGLQTIKDREWGTVHACTASSYFDADGDGVDPVNEIQGIRDIFRKGERILVYVNGNKKVSSFIGIYNSDGKRIYYVDDDKLSYGMVPNTDEHIENLESGKYTYIAGVINNGSKRTVVTGDFLVIE